MKECRCWTIFYLCCPKCQILKSVKKKKNVKRVLKNAIMHRETWRWVPLIQPQERAGMSEKAPKRGNIWAKHRTRVRATAPMVKSPPANAGDVRGAGSIPGLGRFPGGRHSNLFQYCCWRIPWIRGAWLATVYRVTKSCTWLQRFSAHTAHHEQWLSQNTTRGPQHHLSAPVCDGWNTKLAQQNRLCHLLAVWIP